MWASPPKAQAFAGVALIAPGAVHLNSLSRGPGVLLIAATASDASALSGPFHTGTVMEPKAEVLVSPGSIASWPSCPVLCAYFVPALTLPLNHCVVVSACAGVAAVIAKAAAASIETVAVCFLLIICYPPITRVHFLY
ncbi:hypothetical protein ACVLV4_000403 [Rathayibacter agropyri]